MQKLLFICYGIYLAKTNDRLFIDDYPRAWPFGPVFPKVNKRFTPGIPKDIIGEKQNAFLEKKMAMNTVFEVVKEYHNVSAHDLSEWSHQEGGPWYRTIYGDDGENSDIRWNQIISDRIIKEYFDKNRYAQAER
jgi:uncharacterized phage-associated protein